MRMRRVSRRPPGVACAILVGMKCKLLPVVLAYIFSGALVAAVDPDLLCTWSEDEGLGEQAAVPGLDGAEAFTVSIRASWNRADQKGYPNLLSANGWGGVGGLLLFMRDGNLCLRLGAGRGNGGRDRWHEAAYPILGKVPTNVWTLVTCVFRRPDVVTYVDGRVVAHGKWDEPFRMDSGFRLGDWGGAEKHDGRLDDLRIYRRAFSADEVAALAAEGDWKGAPRPPKPAAPVAVFVGARSVLSFDRQGRISSLKEVATGRELVQSPCACVAVKRKGRPALTARRLERRGADRLAFVFPGGAGEAVLDVEPMADGAGWSFRVAALTVQDAEELQCARIVPSCEARCGTFANVLSDDASAVALRAYDVALEMGASRGNGLTVRATKAHGLVGGRFGLVAGPRDGFVAQLRAMSRASGAPLSPSGGAWALDAEANRGSYVFADLSLASVDDWIDLAERGGFEYIHLHGWWQGLGHYSVSTNLFPRGLDDMKAAVARIHAAGLKAGMHSLTACINPYTDSWIRPVCSTNLVADATYTLAAPLSADATEVVVNEMPVAKHDLVFTYSSNGNFLRLGNEVVQYTGIRREPPYAFTGCRRGFFGTKPSAHPAGAACDYLHQRYIAFYPAPDSDLAADLARRLAGVRNACDVDAFYFDGSEGMGTRYGIDRLRHLVYGNFTRAPVAEASCWGAHNWWFHSRLGAWDHSVWAAKRFHDDHVRTTVDVARRDNFLEPQMGWWQPRVGSAAARGHFSEEMEYFASQNAGHDAAMSQQGVNVTRGPLSEFLTRQFTLLGWYERARLARAFSSEAKSRMAVPRAEFRLRQADDGVWSLSPQTSVVHRVSGPAAAAWSFVLAEKPEQATLRVEALYGAADPAAEGATNFLSSADLPHFETAAAAGVKLSVSAERTSDFASDRSEAKSHGDALRLVARNSGAKSRGAWARAVRTYPFPYLSLGGNAAFGFWIRGDGSGALLNLQLRMAREYLGATCEHYVKLDFTGWRFVTLLARERDADDFWNHAWPYGGTIAVCRNPYDGRHVASVALYLNEIPAGGTTDVAVAPVRALPVTKPVVAQAAVTVNGHSVPLPFPLAAGDYAELEDGFWTRYSETGDTLARAPGPKTLPLAAGANRCAFAGRTASGAPARAEVTVLAREASFPAFGDFASERRQGMRYEAMLPVRYAPAKGLDALPRIAVRPGGRVALELTIHGPVREPRLRFGTVRGEVAGAFEAVFPVGIGADERLVCRDGRTWKVLDRARRVKAQGELPAPLPELAAGTDWSMTSADPAAANARVELVKRYR